MATTQTQNAKSDQQIEDQIAESVTDRAALDQIRDQIRDLAGEAASAVTSLTEAVGKIADQVVAARMLFVYERKSDKTGKVLGTDPDWSGRSQAYKLWFNRTVPTIISEQIGDEYGAKVLSRLRYHVQLRVFEQSPQNLRKPLGITDPRVTRKPKASRSSGTDSAEVQAVQQFVAGTDNEPKSLVDLCQDLAAVAAGLHVRIGEEDRPAKRIRDRMLKLMAQANEHIVASAGILQQDPAAVESVAK